MVVALTRRTPVPNYASGMVGWRDERVRAAEEALRTAVRTADDVLESVALEDPLPPEQDKPGPVLRDAW
jgi:hypothetical protein